MKANLLHSSFAVFLSMALWLMPSASGMTQGIPLRPKKAKDEKQTIDPSLTTMEGQLSFDEATTKALERGKLPGVLIGDAQIPDHVYRIEIVNAKKTEPDAVALRLKTKIGQPFNAVLVSEDIIEIMKMGLFSDVEVYREELPSGAILLRYELTEIPTIFQIKVVGNDSLTEDEIKESIAGLEIYHVAKPSRLKENAEKIREFYVSKGYFLATVDVTTAKTKADDIRKREQEGLTETSSSSAIEIDTTNVMAPDFVDVIFTVKENTKVKINRISFSGNHYLSDDVLKANLRSQENHFLSVLADWGTFRKDFLEMDALILEKLLHDNGFLKAKILNPDVEISADKTSINLNFPIVENEQFRLGEVTVDGDLIEKSEVIYRLQKDANPDEAIFLASKLEAMVQQQEGDIFNKSLMAENVLAVAEKYRDDGYAYVNVSPIPEFDDENKIVHIRIQIESGPKVFIERIDIEGNDKTVDKVIRREFALFEGDRYSSSLLRLSEQNVQRLGYFETVEITTEQGSAPDKMIVKAKVKEQNNGSIQAGAGYGTGGEGVLLRAQISNPNLFGRGQTLSASVNWSSYRRMFDVAFIEPVLFYLFDSPVTFAFTAYNRDVFMGEFSRKASGGDITFGYPLGGPFTEVSRKWKRKVRPSLAPYVFDFEALSLMLTYKVERVEISDPTNAVRLFDLHQGVPRYTTSLRPTLILDQRDNRIFPSRGLYFEVRTEFASEYLGGRGLAKLENYIRARRENSGQSEGRDYQTPTAEANNFIRSGAALRFYHNLDEWFFIKGFVFKTNLEIGLLNTLGKPLLFENYSLGGANDVRGYSYRSLTPVERVGALYPFDPRRDVRVGGNKEIHGSFELEFPIFKALKISGVLFFDYGNVFSQEDNFFFIGGRSANAARIKPADPLRLYQWLGLYSSVGFGVRWLSPIGYLRFEWGFPLNPRPTGTPGLSERDSPVGFEFNIGPSF